MPPIAPPASSSRDGAPVRRPGRSVLSSGGSEKDDFMCRVKYLNRLPDLPADPKLLRFDIDMAPYVKYAPTILEKEYKRDIVCDSDMGMKLNLLTIQNRFIDSNMTGAEIDEMLCSEDLLSEPPVNVKASKVDHTRHVAWLRKSQYILNDFAANRLDISAEKQVKKVQPVTNVEFNLRTRLARVEAIQDTFEYANRKQKKHPTRPNLVAVEEIPILPNFDLATNTIVGVTFDSDPAPPATGSFTPEEIMANSMLRGMTDDNGNQIVAHFIPYEDSLRRLNETRGSEPTDEEFSYKLHREFTLPADERKNQKEDTVYSLCVREGEAYYMDMETKVRLIRRGRGAKKGKTKLLVRFRSQAEADEEAKRAELERLEEGSDNETQEEKQPKPNAPADKDSSEDERRSPEAPGSDEDNLQLQKNTRRSSSSSGSSKSSGSDSDEDTKSPPKKVSKTTKFDSDEESD